MPFFRGLDVRVMTNEPSQPDTPFEEYSTQYRASRRFVSTFIEAKTDMCFKIHIKPMVPFINADTGKLLNPPSARDYSASTGNSAYLAQPNSKMGLASRIFFDQSDHLDFSLIIDVDPDDPPDRYYPVDGVFSMGERWEWPEGVVHYSPAKWSFKEIGIERIFGGLSLNSKDDGTDEDTDSSADQDDLPKGKGRAATDPSLEEDLRQRAGEIKLTFWRVRSAAKPSPKVSTKKDKKKKKKEKRNKKKKAKQGSSAGEFSGGGPRDEDITHFIDKSAPADVDNSKTEFFHMDDIDDPNVPFATFVFRYRDKSVLRRLGMIKAGNDRADKGKGKAGMGTEMADKGKRKADMDVDMYKGTEGKKSGDETDDDEVAMETDSSDNGDSAYAEPPPTRGKRGRDADSDDDQDARIGKMTGRMMTLVLRPKH